MHTFWVNDDPGPGELLLTTAKPERKEVASMEEVESSGVEILSQPMADIEAPPPPHDASKVVAPIAPPESAISQSPPLLSSVVEEEALSTELSKPSLRKD